MPHRLNVNWAESCGGRGIWWVSRAAYSERGLSKALWCKVWRVGQQCRRRQQQQQQQLDHDPAKAEVPLVGEPCSMWQQRRTSARW